MKPHYCLIACMAVTAAVSCQKSGALNVGEWKVYHNPVYSEKVTADPCIVEGEDGWFYVYSTATSADLIPIIKSRDLVEWEYVGHAFDKKPDFIPSANLWAPEVNVLGGRYVMWYALSGTGEGNWDTGIGVAVADAPEGPFVDLGKLFTAEEMGVNNSIDPMAYQEDGRVWLIWGSFEGGIWCVEMEADGLSVKEGAEKTQLAGVGYEAAYVYKRDGKYYMFAVPRATLPSTYSAPDGSVQAVQSAGVPARQGTKAYVQPSYRVVLGRADDFLGPYLNGWGQAMLENYHDYLMGPGDVFAGPGHNARIVKDDAGTEWFIYHAYTIANEAQGRTLFIDPLSWEDGWPHIRHQSPSTVADAPVFNGR